MIRFGGLAAIVGLFIWVFAIFDVIATDRSLVRNLPKELWLILVILIPDVGAIAWLIMGRPRGAAFSPGSTERRAPSTPPSQRPDPRRYLGPEDSPDFARRAEEDRLRAWEDDLRRREDEMRRRERGDEI